MFIRKTKVKSGVNGEAYFSYRLVENVRTDTGVKQRTILNLGKHFDTPPEQWVWLSKRIEEIVGSYQSESQVPLFDINDSIDAELEKAANRYAKLIIQKHSTAINSTDDKDGDVSANSGKQYEEIDIGSIDALHPRSIGIEAIAWHAIQQLKLDAKLLELGFNRRQMSAAVGSIVGRMAEPGSELGTHDWLQKRTGLGELLDHDFGTLKLGRLYEISDELLKHQTELEQHLADRERNLFQLNRTVVLYDLTNTYFEGQAQGNQKARFGRSKEKRTDCPLVTLGLVLDGQGFPLRSEVFPGNASEPATLKGMLDHLASNSGTDSTIPVVVMDAGLASEENIVWLKAKGYHYIVVSRERKLEIPDAQGVAVKEDNRNVVTIRRQICPESGEVRLHCHSILKEKKEQSILNRFTQRLEESLEKLRAGLTKKGTTKRYDKVVETVGRLREKNARVAKFYSIEVIADGENRNAIDIQWKLKEKVKESDNPGTYCLRTNMTDWNESRLWQTYIMLTEIESTFRCMKSELGLRPIYHQKEDRVTGHLFITLLAYHVVHTLRFQLKQKGINLSWECIRRIMGTQQRVTVSMKARNGKTIFLRTSTNAESEQKAIYDALGISDNPVGKRRTDWDAK